MVFSSASNNKEREESLRNSLMSKEDICNKLQNLNIRGDERETFINNFNLKIEDTDKNTEGYKVHTNKENCSVQEPNSFKSRNNIVFRNVIFEEEELFEEKFQTCSESESPVINCSESNTIIKAKKQVNEIHLNFDLCSETPVLNNVKNDVLEGKEERETKEEVVVYKEEENEVLEKQKLNYDVSEKQELNDVSEKQELDDVSEKQELRDELSDKQELSDEVSERLELKDEVSKKKELKDEVSEKKDTLTVKIKEDEQIKKPEEVDQLDNNLCSRGGPDRLHFQRPHEIQNQLHCSRRLHNGGRTIVVSEQSVDQLPDLFQPVRPLDPVNIAIPQRNITPLNIFPEGPSNECPPVKRSTDNDIVTQPDLDQFARDVTDQHPEIMFLLDIASNNSNPVDNGFHSNQASSAFNFCPVTDDFNLNLLNETNVNEASSKADARTDYYSSSVCSSSSSSGIITSNSNISSEGDMSPRSYDKSASPIGSPPMTSHPSPAGTSISSSGVSSNGSPQYFVEYYNDSQTFTQAWISSCNQKEVTDKQKLFRDILPKPPSDPPSSPNSVRMEITKKLHPLYTSRALGMMFSKKDDYFQERDEKDGDTHLMVLLCNRDEYHLEKIYAMVERMVKIPGSLSIKNNAGHSALYIACLRMQHEPLVPAYIAEALIKQNVDVAQLTYSGLTLPKILCWKGEGYEEILKELVAVKNSSGQLIFQSFLSDINGNV